MLFGGSVCFISHARVNVVFGFWALMPWYTVTTSVSRPWPHHGRSIAWPSSPSGPMTAVFRPFSSGSVPSSFLSSTVERPAASRAAFTASGSSIASSVASAVGSSM